MQIMTLLGDIVIQDRGKHRVIYSALNNLSFLSTTQISLLLSATAISIS